MPATLIADWDAFRRAAAFAERTAKMDNSSALAHHDAIDQWSREGVTTMQRQPNFEPKGVIPACILPFRDDLEIDEGAYRRHLRDVAGVAGVSAITVNAHATEVASCSFEEQRRVLDLAMDAIGDRTPIVNGIYADGSLEAARIARMAAAGGASALLVFPPNPFILGQTDAMVLAHFQRIADATDLPLIAFQYPLAGGQGYPLERLLRLIEEVPSVRAIKDWCNVVPQHETHIRMLQNLTRPVNVLTTHSSWLLSSLVLGCRGLLSGMGSVVADLQSALFAAVQADDLARARAVNERLSPLAAAFYADPFVDMHNRMKAALVLLGRIPCAAVRPPLVAPDAAEIERLRVALAEAKVARDGARLEAA
ncbi:MAG TPA: dihydrodipicolinate synthase family protein [Stellaceae bacterium]|nr:dihydrodipicolinate synthase family protein [Stellaceae bacterium]